MLIFDAHCDILSKVKEPEELLRNGFRWDMTRAARYGTFIQVMASFADNDLRADPSGVMNKQLEKALRFESSHPDIFKIVRSKSELYEARPGIISGILSAEGGEILKGDIRELDRLFGMGLRVMNLSWNYDNEVCDSAVGRHIHKGLSPFGRDVVQRMQELGMLIDISHASDETVDEVLEITRFPVTASHSNCRALCGRPRNLTDDQIVRIAGKGGVTGINLFAPFLSDSGKPGLTDILNHIEHMAGLVGTEHIGLGCDFDGGEPLAAGIEGVQSIGTVLDALAMAGYSKESIEMIAGKNYLSLFTQVLH